LPRPDAYFISHRIVQTTVIRNDQSLDNTLHPWGSNMTEQRRFVAVQHISRGLTLPSSISAVTNLK
jgi:hypothetical protein